MKQLILVLQTSPGLLQDGRDYWSHMTEPGHDMYDKIYTEICTITLTINRKYALLQKILLLIFMLQLLASLKASDIFCRGRRKRWIHGDDFDTVHRRYYQSHMCWRYSTCYM